MPNKIICKRYMTDKQCEKLHKTFLDDNSYDRVVTEDVDGYDSNGNMLFKFRKNALAYDVVKLGYKSFEDSIEKTEGRGAASGSSHKRIRKDGSIANTTVGNFVESGNVGFMDSSAMVRYCRKTAFARNYFDKFTAGIPFVEEVDRLYEELAPEHYAIQKKYALATNKNYRIGDTVFTTVTVNRNFMTAVHKDSGDLPQGFGNLCVYREGHYDGGFFCLPEYRVAIDMQTTDMLFVDVHHWHGNTPIKNASDDWLRIAFVMYMREYMVACKGPSEELARVKMDQTGFYKL